MNEPYKKILNTIIPYIIIIIVVVIIRSFVITPIQVDGMSMYSTLSDNEILILKKYNKNYKRFDIVVFDYNGKKLIKRIIGLPGETLEYKNNKLYINGKYVKEDFLNSYNKTYDFKLENLGYKKIPDNTYFVMGDNRINSTDSRIIGPVLKNQIDGKTNFAIYPINRFGKFN